jgi:4-diphosphocytidyl-2-C-methyl-D-erythritol kinase
MTTVRSYAKINWALRITGKRPDGYHDLETLFQQISLHDEISFEKATRLSLTCDDPAVPADDTNLVIRAAQALKAPPVAIELRKKIPAGGGLGGGSSNAAATLVALNDMFAMNTSPERLAAIALELGSDVPFFLMGGTAYATGRGEVLTPMPAVKDIPLIVVVPPERVSTMEAFRRVSRYSQPLGLDRFRAMANDDFLKRRSFLTNDFEESVFALVPAVGLMKRRLLDVGADWAAMSGSGSCVVGAFETVAARDAALKRFGDVRAVAAETL